jgi:hypothetical protein
VEEKFKPLKHTMEPTANNRNRQTIRDEFKSLNEQIKALYAKMKDLEREDLLLCDDEQWFTEQEEDVVVKRRPRIVEKKLIGRIHWKEDFKDEDTGEVITIDRCETVRVNGEWVPR